MHTVTEGRIRINSRRNPLGTKEESEDCEETGDGSFHCRLDGEDRQLSRLRG